MEYGYKGDYKGFTFNDVHSSTLGIVRVSNSNRYLDNLVPNIVDSNSDVPGADGQYIFGSKYNNRTFTIQFAFDYLSELQLKQLKKVLCDNTVHPLIFDELPYKVYYAKVTGVATIKHLCEIVDNQRIYKGEGSITFTCYYVYARSRYQYIEDYTLESIPEWQDDSDDTNTDINDPWTNVALIKFGDTRWDDEMTSIEHGALIGYESEFIDWVEITLLMDVDCAPPESIGIIMGGSITGQDNLNEWRDSSYIPSNQNYGMINEHQYRIFNAGDVPMSFKFWGKLPETSNGELSFTISCGNKRIVVNNLKRDNNYPNDKYIVLDTTCLTLEGRDEYNNQTGSIYNRYIDEYTLMAIPTGEQLLTINGIVPSHLEFNYLYY